MPANSRWDLIRVERVNEEAIATEVTYLSTKICHYMSRHMTFAGIDGTLMNKESWFDCNLARVDVKKKKNNNKTMALSEPVDLPIPQ